MVAKGWPEALCAVIYISEYDLKKKRNNGLVVNAEGSEDVNSQDVQKDKNHWAYLESSRRIREISLTENCLRLNHFWRSWVVRKTHVLSQVGISGSWDGETSEDVLNSEQDSSVCSFLTGGPVSLCPTWWQPLLREVSPLSRLLILKAGYNVYWNKLYSSHMLGHRCPINQWQLRRWKWLNYYQKTGRKGIWTLFAQWRSCLRFPTFTEFVDRGLRRDRFKQWLWDGVSWNPLGTWGTVTWRMWTW